MGKTIQAAPLQPPPSQGIIPIKNADGDQIGTLNFRDSRPWLGFFLQLFNLQKQIFFSVGLGFPGPIPPNSSEDIIVAYDPATAPGYPDIKADSFLVMRGPLNIFTSDPIAPPANAILNVFMTGDNSIGFRFNNYSAAPVTPAQVDLEVLIIPRRHI